MTILLESEKKTISTQKYISRFSGIMINLAFVSSCKLTMCYCLIEICK